MSTACHNKVLPQWVDALKLTTQGIALGGEILPEGLPRLLEVVDCIDYPVEVSLQFYTDGSGHRIVSGDIAASLSLICQRCLLPVRRDIEANANWIVVAEGGDDKGLPKRFEPWLIDKEGADLYHQVEEEILVALPIVAFHPPLDCGGSPRYSTEDAAAVNRRGPFNVLQALKSKS